jgi:membrane-bound lytic murein transglycosylase D
MNDLLSVHIRPASGAPFQGGRWLAGLLALVTIGCSQNRPPARPTALAAPADTATVIPAPPSDSMLAAAAAEEGMDTAAVLEANREANRALEELPEDAQREFLDLFGPDPLGLADRPRNAERYEISLETNEAVERWIDYFQNTVPDRFATYLSRLGRYEDMVRARLRASNMPQDLMYLALIESGMNPNAYSRAHAVGMWQFIRGTGRLYGLEVSYFVDERRDPVKSTDAAIAFLSDLYDEFGSWYLAAAAYNGGPGRVRRGIRRTGSNDFWDLSDARVLRSETRNYVPKLIAAALIAKDPERYGFTNIERQAPLQFEEVTVPDATSMDVIADAAGTEEGDIRSLNPQYLRRVTPPGREATVRVPPGTGTMFATNYAKIPADKRVTWLVHTVTRGQTLGQIASRYGTSVQAIRAANNNVNPRRLQIGQRLVVPRAGAASRPARDPRVMEAPDGGALTVTVRAGDTLWAIAQRYDVSTTELMVWNGLSSSRIHPGDRITVRR